jgi:hypothetical protein
MAILHLDLEAQPYLGLPGPRRLSAMDFVGPAFCFLVLPALFIAFVAFAVWKNSQGRPKSKRSGSDHNHAHWDGSAGDGSPGWTGSDSGSSGSGNS